MTSSPKTKKLAKWTPEDGAPYPGGIVDVRTLDDVRQGDHIKINENEFYVDYSVVHSFTFSTKDTDDTSNASTVHMKWLLMPCNVKQQSGFLPLEALIYFLRCGFHLTRCQKDAETRAETEEKHKRWEIERLQNGSRWDVEQ